MAAGKITLAATATKKAPANRVKLSKLTLVAKKKSKKQKAKVPFPTVMRNVLQKYINDGPFNATWAGGLAYFKIARFSPYSLYDVDVDNTFGNNQPLYFDQLCSTQGPYNSFRVKSYSMKFTIINTSSAPLIVYLADSKQFTGGIAENDTPDEIRNFPGVKKMLLTASGGSKSHGTISIRGSRKQEGTGSSDYQTIGNSGASPANLGSIVTLMVMSADGAAAGTAVIESTISCVADFMNIDAQPS